MKKAKSYRVLAAFMAALMVVTCIPQSGMYVWAQEETAVKSEAQLNADEKAGQEQSEKGLAAESAEKSPAVPAAEEAGAAIEISPNEGETNPPAKEQVHVDSIKLDHEKVTIQRKDSVDLKYTLAPNNADVELEKVVTYASANEDVATVTSKTGGVTVVAEGVGKTTVTATTGNGKMASCEVEVTPIPVKTVIIEPSSLKLTAGETTARELNIVVDPTDADNTNVSLRLDYDEKVIEVDDTNLNTLKKISVKPKKAGTTVIVVVSQDNKKIYGSCNVTVEGTDIAVEDLAAKDGYQDNLNLYEGSSINLTSYVIFKPAGATDKKLEWSVDGDKDAAGDPQENPDRAYVDVNQSTGRVTAKWKEGDTADEHPVSIIATSTNGKSVSFTIKIKRNNVPLKALYVDPAELVLDDAGRRNERTISVQLDPLTTTDRVIIAKVSDKDGKTAVLINGGRSYVAEKAGADAEAKAERDGRVYFTVRANELEGLNKQDNCTITFTKKGADASLASTCKVTVNKYVTPVEKLELQPEVLEMKDGEEKTLTAVIGPLTAEDRNIVWTVDDPEIASIEKVIKKVVNPDGSKEEVEEDFPADGRIEAVLDTNELSATVKIKANMVGKCTITAIAAGDVTKICEVTVKSSDNPATGLTITSDGITEGETTEITLKKGQTYTLKPKVTPDGAANKTVKWTSESPEVADVVKGANEAGVVTANKLGHTTITARASGESSACTKTVLVTVINPHLEVEYPEHWSYAPEDQPITEEMLRGNLKVFFYPVEKPLPAADKWVLAKEETYNYDLKILKEDGKSEKNYEQEDMEKPGIKTLIVSFAYDGATYRKSVPVEMKEFNAADLISVTQLTNDDAEVWNVPNATPASALPLAKTTEILVGRKIIVDGNQEEKTSRLDAEIKWHVSESGYDSSNTEAQDFTVFGEVMLPSYVTNTKNVSLRVEARVHVREQASSGKKTARPAFSVLGGEQIGNSTTVTVPYGSKIVIESATEEAEIYYMVDRRPDEDRGVPKDAEHRYKSPVEITARTTTIYAVAAKHGFDDSDCSECTIKLEREDLFDPDDPDAVPLPDDVTDEDREQIGGKVPDGLWAVVQKEADEKDGFAYTGKAIKPVVRVYDRTMLLTEKKDYTVAYSNNINAGSAEGSMKPPTITVTGKGNYDGKAVVRFTIKPQSIQDDSVLMDEYLAAAYNEKEQKPNPSLTWNGKKLIKNKDYTFTDVSYTEPGVYKLTVNGIGNYTGSRTLNYEIYHGGVSVSELTVTKIPNYKYTGAEIRPDVTVKYKKTVLFEGTEKGSTGNYWIKYENCTNVGNASVVIVGKGGYKGSKRINFKIQPVAKISQAGITLDVPPAGVDYTGKAHTPKCTVNYLGKQLVENKDYKLSYQNNVNAGKATVVLTGMGAFNGTAKKTFKILQNNISGLAAVMDSSYVYEKGGCKPKPEVTFNGMKLKEGTDYTLSYKNHNKIGNTAYVTIKGKGNYKGQIVRYFEVTMQDISKLKVVANDKAYQRKKNIYKTKVQVIDKNGKALSAGTDYSRDIYYTYETGDRAGQPVLATDIIPAGTVIGVDIRVANPRCYHGTIHGTYRIVQSDISGAKVSIEPQEYTGRSIRLKKSQIQVTLKGVLLGDKDYEIVGYENNVNQGSAKITIKGVGSYGGTKTATFKIKKKGILNLKF